MGNLNDYVSAPEAVRILGVSKQRVNTLIHTRWKDRCEKVSTRFWLIPRRFVEEYKEEVGQKYHSLRKSAS